MFRRVFCSDDCKNLFGRQKTANKIEALCQNCGSTFLRYPSQKGKFCSYKCKNTSQRRFSSSTCKHCLKGYEAKPTRLNVLYCSRKCFHEAGRETRTYVTCQKTFRIEKASTNIRCSRRCQFIDQSNGRIKIRLNGRSGYRTDIGKDYYFKSALEADFARVMIHLGILFSYETKTFQTEKGAYTPDFYLSEFDTFVELKGVENNGKPYTQMMTKNLAAHSILRAHNHRIITVTQKEFITILKNENLWRAIPNLEQRNYKKTAHLVIKHENQTTPTNHASTTNHAD